MRSSPAAFAEDAKHPGTTIDEGTSAAELDLPSILP